LNSVRHTRHLGLAKVLLLCHLLLLEQEFLLLLLYHSFLEHLLELHLNFFGKVLLLYHLSILIKVRFFFALILGILEKLNDLFSRQVIRYV
jgi:hypothetical protein